MKYALSDLYKFPLNWHTYISNKVSLFIINCLFVYYIVWLLHFTCRIPKHFPTKSAQIPYGLVHKTQIHQTHRYCHPVTRLVYFIKYPSTFSIRSLQLIKRKLIKLNVVKALVVCQIFKLLPKDHITKYQP